MGAVPSKWEDILIDGNEVKNLGREGIYFYSYWSIRWNLDEPNAGAYYPSEGVIVRTNTVDNIWDIQYGSSVRSLDYMGGEYPAGRKQWSNIPRME